MNIQELRDKPIFKKQQGDVIIRKVTLEIDNTFNEVKLKPGESIVPSENSHSIQGGSLYTKDGARFVRFKKAGKFVHLAKGSKPHATINVVAGVYFIEQKVEIDFLNDMKRPVQD